MARTKTRADLQAERVQAEEDAKSARSPQEPARLRQEPVYTCSCNSIVCQIECCTEPLAWNIKEGHVLNQNTCILFTVLPKEIRDLIYEYALTESTYNQPGFPRPDDNAVWKGVPLHYDCANNLLLTCKAVYLETYILPLRLNPLQLPWYDGSARHVPKVRLPWQFANIQSFDITLQQFTLENGRLHDFFFGSTAWQPGVRHKGCFVAPYTGLDDRKGSYSSHNFTLLSTEKQDDRIRIRNALDDTSLPSGFQAPLSDMRLLRARPLVHLTLRMLRDQWWTWADEPGSKDLVHHHLGLDPAVGDGCLDIETRPTCPRMQELAQQRRDGHYPGSNGPAYRKTPDWGHVIGELPDIKSLELVFETFKDKLAQLENVIDCAKTWSFPIVGTQCELIWSGRVESIQWSEPLVDNWRTRTGTWHARTTEFEVRIIRFTRK